MASEICWLCSGKRPGCKCTGEEIDDAIGGRPDGNEIWDPNLTHQVHSNDTWLSDASALAGSHHHLGDAVPPASNDHAVAILHMTTALSEFAHRDWQPFIASMEGLGRALNAMVHQWQADHPELVGRAQAEITVGVRTDWLNAQLMRDIDDSDLTLESPSATPDDTECPF